MPPVERFGRVVDDDRLRGVWLHSPVIPLAFTAPVRLPSGGFGLCTVEVRMEPDPSRRCTFWAVLTRQGPVLGGDFDLPAVTSWQALAAVERLLAEAGIAVRGD